MGSSPWKRPGLSPLTHENEFSQVDDVHSIGFLGNPHLTVAAIRSLFPGLGRLNFRRSFSVMLRYASISTSYFYSWIV